MNIENSKKYIEVTFNEYFNYTYTDAMIFYIDIKYYCMLAGTI